MADFQFQFPATERPKSKFKMNAAKRQRLKDALVSAGRILLWVQTFVFVGFIGAVGRKEISLYAWVEYERDLRFGTFNALLGATGYVLCYAFVAEVAGYVLRLLLVSGKVTAHTMRQLAVCSFWVLFTFLAFGNSVFQFVRNLPTDVMNGWLIIGWIATTVIAGMSFWRLLSARLEEYRHSSLGFRYERFLDRHGLLGDFYEEESQRNKGNHSQRILLVEDEKPIREIVASILASDGFNCCKAEDGEMAMSLLASGARINLVLSNMLLPKVDGWTLFLHIRKHYPNIPFVFVTAIDDSSVREAATREGAAAFLLKPFDRQELLSVVRRVLEQG